MIRIEISRIALPAPSCPKERESSFTLVRHRVDCGGHTIAGHFKAKSWPIMFATRIRAVACVFALIACVCAQSTQEWQQVKAAGYNQIASSGQSKLYTVNTIGNYQYKWPIYVVDLHGSHYQMGYDYGALLGNQVVDNYKTFFSSLLGSTFFDAFKLAIVEDFLDWQVRFDHAIFSKSGITLSAIILISIYKPPFPVFCITHTASVSSHLVPTVL